MGSSPNITSSGLHHPSDPYGDQTLLSAGTASLRRQSGRHPQTLDSAGQGEASSFDLQNQLRELQRENDSLRRELDGGRDGRTGPSVNSVNFWSPDVKRDKGVRREEGVRAVALKDQHRTNQEDLQVRKCTIWRVCFKNALRPRWWQKLYKFVKTKHKHFHPTLNNFSVKQWVTREESDIFERWKCHFLKWNSLICPLTQTFFLSTPYPFVPVFKVAKKGFCVVQF